MNLKTKTREDLELILYDISCKYSDKTKELIEAQSIFENLDGQRKTYYESVVDRIEGSSIADRERKAQLDISWINWQTAYTKAKISFSQLRLEREVIQNKWDTCKQILISKMKI